VIVVIGSPILRLGSGAGGREIAGLAGQVGLAAAAADRTVQLVGKVGNDDAGDALLVALAGARIGHAATLRDASHATPVVHSAGPADDDEPDGLFLGDESADSADGSPLPAGLPLDPADLELALRYLTDFRVVVIAAPLDAATLRVTLDAAAFSGAHVIRLDGSAQGQSDATVEGVEITAFEAPTADEPAFATMVGRYAAGLDAGRTPGDAFADATRGANWERAAQD
jgi:hypothetical protein